MLAKFLAFGERIISRHYECDKRFRPRKSFAYPPFNPNGTACDVPDGFRRNRPRAQQKNGGAQTPTPGQQTQQPSPNGGPPSTPGITGGTDPIESVLFAYKALTSDGVAISGQIRTTLAAAPKSMIVIATPTDVNALVQWRAVVGQLSLLKKRADDSEQLARPDIPQYSKSVESPQPPGPGGGRFGFIASPADVQTLAQTALTLASAFAVNESLASSAGAITDTPLINAVARSLHSSTVSVYVPSVYPPNLARNSGLTNTFIWDKIAELEDKRVVILSDIQTYLQALDDANTIAAASAASGYTPDDKVAAKRFANEAKTIAALVADLNSIVAAIDTFEGSLFSGQTPSPAPSGNPNANGSGNGTGAPTGTTSPTGTTVAPPVNPNGPNNGNPVTPAPSPQLSGGNQPGGTTLQQIMLGDLLAHEIWGGTDPPSQDVLNTIHILSVHALESGGGQLTKSWLFIGSRIYFSGGAVATFSLYGVNGGIECSGYAYDYSGYIREKSFEKVLRENKSSTAVVTTDGSCSASPVGPGAIPAASQNAPNPADHSDAAPSRSQNATLLLPVIVRGKFGYIDTQGKLVIHPQFTLASRFSEGLAAAGAIGPDDIFPSAGYIDPKGSWVIKRKFDFAGDFHEGFARVKLASNFSHALVSLTGQLISVPNGDDYRAVLGDVVEGLAVFSPDGYQFGFIDTTGTAVITPRFQAADSFSEGLALVKDNGRFGFIDKSGHVIIEAKYAHATDFRQGRALVCIERDGNCGSIDKNGTFVASPHVLSFERWESGDLAGGSPDSSGLRVVAGNKGYADETGTLVIGPKYYQEGEFSEGLAAQTLDQYGRCGYIDKTGKLVIPAIFTNCDRFENGYASIEKIDQDAGTRYGYIDTKGKPLWLSK